jgi:hypothetical protein
MNVDLKRRPFFCPFTILSILSAVMCWSSIAEAQQYQRSEAPIVGRYPGGHTGLRGGATPHEEGLGYFVFNRFHSNTSLKGANGQTISPLQSGSYTLTNGFEYITDYKILGMKYGALLAIPMVHGAINRENSTNSQFENSSLGLADILFVPLMLFGTSHYWDYQFGAGVFFPTGSYSAGSTLNRGSGYPVLPTTRPATAKDSASQRSPGLNRISSNRRPIFSPATT